MPSTLLAKIDLRTMVLSRAVGGASEARARLRRASSRSRRDPSRELLEESRVSLVLSASFRFRKGRGCGHCRGTGYHGRKAVGELMVLNDEIREAIVSRVPVRQLKELARQAGVQLIRSSALDLVRRGLTTIEEVNRVTIMA